MDTDDEIDRNAKKNNLSVIDCEKHGDDGQIDEVDNKEESELNALLPPRKGGMSRKSKKVRRSVQWNDRNGNKLVEILEFQPSDVSDSDSDDSDSCICCIM